MAKRNTQNERQRIGRRSGGKYVCLRVYYGVAVGLQEGCGVSLYLCIYCRVKRERGGVREEAEETSKDRRPPDRHTFESR